MTQPPDERPGSDQPTSEGGSENEPTVAWTPPEPPADRAPDEGGVGYAAMPDEGAQPPAAPAPEPPASTPQTPEPPPPPAPQEPAQPASPIISAAPTASSWDTPPAAPGPATPPPGTPPAATGSGWDVPPAAAAVVATQQDGYVIAGVGARFVAWLIDSTLANIIPAALTLALVDFTGIFRRALEEAERNPTGSFSSTPYTIPITTNYILVTLIGIGIQYLYFVGFWTSRWRATPGMIGLKMRVVDAMTGNGLSIVAATKRWIALGFPLALLGLVPALQSATSLIQFALLLFLFFTTVTNDRRQGLHDKWADSLVIRSVTSGNGATFAGCLFWGVLVIVLGFIAVTVVFAGLMPVLQEYIDTLPRDSI